MTEPMPASGWEARAVLAVAQEHLHGVEVPRGDRAAIAAARREVARARTIASDPDRLGRRELEGCLAVIAVTERIASRPSPWTSINPTCNSLATGTNNDRRRSP